MPPAEIEQTNFRSAALACRKVQRLRYHRASVQVMTKAHRYGSTQLSKLTAAHGCFAGSATGVAGCNSGGGDTGALVVAALGRPFGPSHERSSHGDAQHRGDGHGLRGYYLTGDQTFLDSYNDMKAKVPEQLDTMIELTADNPEPAGATARSSAAVWPWMQWADQQIERGHQNPPSPEELLAGQRLCRKFAISCGIS